MRFAGKFARIVVVSAMICCGVTILFAALHRSSAISAKLPHVTHATEEAGVLTEPFAPRPYPLQGFVLDEALRDQLVVDCLDWSFRSGIGQPSVALHAIRLQSIAHGSSHPEKQTAFEQLQKVLLDDSAFREVSREMPLLVDTAYGANFRRQMRGRNLNALDSSIGGAPHTDAVLAAVSEAGISLSAPITSASGRHATLTAVLEDSLRRTSSKAQQGGEVEWTVSALTRHLKAMPRWTNRRGETVSFEDLVRQLLQLRISESACYGTHRLYSLALVVNRARAEPEFVDRDVVGEIEAHLREVSHLLARTQLADGTWDQSWMGVPQAQNPEISATTVVEDKVRVTGHMLEWMALVPQTLRSPVPVMERATTGLVILLRNQQELCFDKYLLPTTHAVRALCLLSEEL